MHPSEPALFLNRAHFPVTTLGYGRRVAVWFQGCGIRCPGCVSRDTWAAGETAVSLDNIAQMVRPWLAEADGLTISGGEPFEQPEALAALVRWWRGRHAGDVLVYSGFTWSHLERQQAAILALVDAVISEPYDAAAPQTLPLRGSDNQRLHLLTPLARRLYRDLPAEQALDLCVDGDQMWLAGIPRKGDMQRLRRQLAALGLSAATSDQLSPAVLA